MFNPALLKFNPGLLEFNPLLVFSPGLLAPNTGLFTFSPTLLALRFALLVILPLLALSPEMLEFNPELAPNTGLFVATPEFASLARGGNRSNSCGIPFIADINADFLRSVPPTSFRMRAFQAASVLASIYTFRSNNKISAQSQHKGEMKSNTELSICTIKRRSLSCTVFLSNCSSS